MHDAASYRDEPEPEPKPKPKPKAKPGRKPKAMTQTQTKDGGSNAPARRSGRVVKAGGQPTRRAKAVTSASKLPPAKEVRKKGIAKPKAAAGAGGREWEVEKIVDSRIDADTCEHFYQVKWKGYSSKDNTWEPKLNLANCPGLIRAFEAKK